MVYLNTDDLQGNMDSFGKDKMIENVLMPNITKVAAHDSIGLIPMKDSKREEKDLC